MKAGLFLMPSHPPERDTYEALQWDLDTISYADQLGYAEVWIGEHFTAIWEPVPAPDLMVAQALLQTSQIRLGVGSFLLPFHHPAELAQRIAYLDHIAQGRFMFGVGAGGLATDMELFQVDMAANQHRDMTREALEIILGIWDNMDNPPWRYDGKYWSVSLPELEEFSYGTLGSFRKPLTKPYPPIGISAASPNSTTLRMAGERGFLPMSLGLNAQYMPGHWDAVLEGAAESGREPPSRSEWRVVRDFWVADTDEEARDTAWNGGLGRAWREYLQPLFAFGEYPITRNMKHDPSLPDEAVTPEYIMEHMWLVGSPQTVADKIRELYEWAGGFGVLLGMVVDHKGDDERWKKSMRLMQEEVMPLLSDLEY